MGRRRLSPGWVPQHHGAWAMLVVPLLVGVVHAGAEPWHALLAATWLVGYFAFHAAGLLLRARGRARYRPPVVAYGATTFVLGVALLLARPTLAWWALAFAPLLTLSLVASWRRADRSWWNDAATITAACLLAAVAHTPGPPVLSATAVLVVADPAPPHPLALTDGSVAAWQLVALLALYFLGTVWYVKSMIRERGNRAVLAGSVAWHALAVPVAALVMAAPGPAPSVAALTSSTGGQGLDVAVTPWLVALLAALAVRAALVPTRWPGARPMAIGLGEIAASTALTLVLLAA